MHGGNLRRTRSVYSPEQVRSALGSAGVDICNEVDTDFIVYCPYHDNYRTPAGEIDKVTGAFFCFSCQESHSLVDFVMKVSGRTYFQAIRIIEQGKTDIDLVGEIEGTLEIIPDFEAFDTNLILRLHSQAMDSDRAKDYFASRHITLDSMEKYMLGYSETQDMVTIPIMNPEGDMYVGFVGRGVGEKKFKNSNKLPRAKTMFNIQRAKRSRDVYVVESSFDAIRLEQQGVAAVALLGSSVNQRQGELLSKYFNNVIVIGDNDDAGRQMGQKLLDKLGKSAIIVGIPSRFKDVGDMTDDDIKQLIYRIDDPTISL